MNISRFCRTPGFLWSLLLVYSGIIFFVNIHTGGIYSAQEGRAAIVARNMINSSDYTKIEIKGEPENEKPIFCYWLYALCGEVFGVNEFSVRLPSVLAALTSIICAAYLGMRIYGQPTGYISGYVLATMFGFVNLGRIARIDMVLCAFYAVAMVFLYEGYFRKRKGNAWLYLFYVMIAIGVAVKGPVSIFLVALTVLILLIMEWNFKKTLTMLWELKPISGMLICLAICVPWMIFEMARTTENFALDFFWTQNIDRFLGIQTQFSEGKRKSLFYYLPKLFGMALPWALLVPLLFWQFRKSWRKLRPQTWFLVIWVVAIFGFFSLSFIKRGDYLLPLFPALAVLLGRYATLLTEKGFRITWHWKIVWGVLAGLTAVVWVGILFGWFDALAQAIISQKIPHLSSRDGMAMRDYLEIFSTYPWITLILAAAALGILYLFGRQLQRGESFKALSTLMGILLIVFVFFYTCLDPISGRTRTTKDFCLRIQPLLPPDAYVAYIGSWVDEAAFFVNRDYENCAGRLDLVYDAPTDTFKFKYIISDSDYWKDTLSKEKFADRLEELDATVPDHHYPLTLLRVKD